jgi:hypothetical protein
MSYSAFGAPNTGPGISRFATCLSFSFSFAGQALDAASCAIESHALQRSLSFTASNPSDVMVAIRAGAGPKVRNMTKHVVPALWHVERIADIIIVLLFCFVLCVFWFGFTTMSLSPLCAFLFYLLQRAKLKCRLGLHVVKALSNSAQLF